MTDRYSGFVVVLEDNLREDDAQATIQAIKQVRGVLSVVPQIGAYSDILAHERVHNDLRGRLWAVLNDREMPA